MSPLLSDKDRVRKIGLLILINIALLLFIVAGIEIVLRIFPLVQIQWVQGNLQTGFDMPPYYEEHFIYPEHPDGAFSYYTNNMGFREDDDTEPVKTDSFRIVVLGDSHTNGVCWNRESYANRLEFYLNRQDPGRTFEVINAGVGKYSPFQYLRAFQYRIKPLKPDLVIIGFYIGNDFFDMFRRDDRPYLQLLADGRIVEMAPEFYFYTAPGFAASWRSKSYCYYLLFGSRLWKSLSYNLTRAVIFYRNMKEMEDISTGDVLQYFADIYRLSRTNRHATTQSLAQFAFFHYFPQKRRQSFRLVDYVFKEFAKEQTPLLVMPIPTKFGIESFRIRTLHRKLARKFPYITLDQPQTEEDILYDELIARLRQLNIDVLDVRPILREQSAEHQLYYDTDYHINPTAHDILGSYLCQHLLKKIF